MHSKTMKKILFITSILPLLLASSCNKKDSAPVNNTWAIDGKTYHVAFATYQGSTFSASDALDTNRNMCSFIFSGPSKPTGGTYKVVGSLSSMYAPGEVVVGAWFKNNKVVYESTDNSKTTLTVSGDGNRISIYLPDTYVQDFATKDSVLISAHLTQTY